MTIKQAIAMFALVYGVDGADIPDGYAGRIADAIYRAEGGAKTRFPYGVKYGYVRTKDMHENRLLARKVCQYTIRRSWRRWLKAGQPGDFIDYLGDHYCPPSVDPIGNKDWKRNVKRILK